MRQCDNVAIESRDITEKVKTIVVLNQCSIISFSHCRQLRR